MPLSGKTAGHKKFGMRNGESADELIIRNHAARLFYSVCFRKARMRGDQRKKGEKAKVEILSLTL